MSRMTQMLNKQHGSHTPKDKLLPTMTKLTIDPSSSPTSDLISSRVFLLVCVISMRRMTQMLNKQPGSHTPKERLWRRSNHLWEKMKDLLSASSSLVGVFKSVN